VIDEVISSSGEVSIVVPDSSIIGVPLIQISEATQGALDDRDMTIARVDDTIVVTTSTGVSLDDTTLSGAIAEVTVAIAADTEIISADR
jgi:hypothetical protein